jgi:serine/threonine protein kinase
MISINDQQVGNYKLCHLLGRGGCAEVYLGEHIFLKKQVAIKLLHARFADPSALKNFHREAQLIASLDHPHIVRVLEFGLADTIPYLAMEYAQNGSLRQRYRKGTRLPLDTILSYVTQIGAAIQYAHDHKLVHRDIKPDNILLDQHDKILLSDFGIALLQETSQQSTKDAIGTVAYMAPEQLQGKPCFASDQYALSIMIYEWISGNTPFQGSSTEIGTQHLFTQPPSLREQIPTLSPEVEQVIFRALAKDPTKRFPTIQTFVLALKHATHNPCSQTGREPIQSLISSYTKTEHAQTTIFTSTSTLRDTPSTHSHLAITPALSTQRSLTDWIISYIVYPLGYTIMLYLLLLIIGFFSFGRKKDLFTNTPSPQLLAMITGIFVASLCIVICVSGILKRRRLSSSLHINP